MEWFLVRQETTQPKLCSQDRKKKQKATLKRKDFFLLLKISRMVEDGSVGNREENMTAQTGKKYQTS